MSFYPDVAPGDKFVPDVKLSNDIRHLVNAAHGFQDCKQKGVPPAAVRVSVFNATEEIIPANTAVIFTSDAPRGEVLPIKPAPSGTTDSALILEVRTTSRTAISDFRGSASGSRRSTEIS